MKKESRFRQKLTCLILTAGVFFLLYPIIANILKEKKANEIIQEYNTKIEETSQTEFDRMLDEVREYNRELAENGMSEVSYDDLLAITDSLGYIEIPKIGIYLPVYRGISDDILQKGIGHMPETSLPVGGESTHSVLSGHTGLPAAKLFTDLDQMEEGDRFYLHVLNEVLAYETDQIKVVLPEETDDIRIQEGEDLVTLLTCTPFGINSHRLLVRGKRIPFEREKKGLQVRVEPEAKEVISVQKWIWYLLILIGIIAQQISFWRMIRK